MKKKLKIVLLAVAGLVILYHLMFYHVVGGTDSIDEIRDCYDGFMITVKARDSWLGRSRPYLRFATFRFRIQS